MFVMDRVRDYRSINVYVLFKGHLSWSFYFLNVLGIVNSHIINYICDMIKGNESLVGNIQF